MNGQSFDKKVDLRETGVSPKFLLAQKYNERVQALRAKYPNCIVLSDIALLPQALETYNVTQKDLLTIGPWAINSFITYIGKDLPFILINHQARELYPEALATLGPERQRATKLFSYADLVKHFETHLESNLESVLLPISLFTDKPTLYRRAFKEQRQKYLDAIKAGRRVVREASNPILWLCSREAIKDTSTYHLLTQWSEDIEELRARQGKADSRSATLPSIRTHLPAGVLPKFFSTRDVSRMNGVAMAIGCRYIQRDGWVRHLLKGPDGRMLTNGFYTPGPLFGGPQHWEDYKIGATVLVTTTRAKELLPMEQLTHPAHWRFEKEGIVWTNRTDLPDPKRYTPLKENFALRQ